MLPYCHNVAKLLLLVRLSFCRIVLHEGSVSTFSTLVTPWSSYIAMFIEEERVECEQTFNVLCGLGDLEEIFIKHLEQMGLCYNSTSSIYFVLDAPPCTALRSVEQNTTPITTSIVVTYNTCPEYCEDLWDLGIAGLIAGDQVLPNLTSAFWHAAVGLRYRVTPSKGTCLTLSERRALRKLADGLDNRQIAEQLALSHQRVKTVLSEVYAKLGLYSHREAMLYYWNLYSAGRLSEINES